MGKKVKDSSVFYKSFLLSSKFSTVPAGTEFSALCFERPGLTHTS